MLLLKLVDDTFKGVWVSPDGKKKYDIEFEKKYINQQKNEDLEFEFEELNFLHYDC